VKDDYTVSASGNFIQPIMTEVDHTSSHNLLVNSWAARVNNAPKYTGIKAIQKYRNKFRTLLAKHKGLKFTLHQHLNQRGENRLEDS
jgi:hypothetical protein